MKFKSHMKADPNNFKRPKNAPMRFDSHLEAEQFCTEYKASTGKERIPVRNKDGSFGIKKKPMGQRLQSWLDEPISKKDELKLS
jgi:hypothetical protein